VPVINQPYAIARLNIANVPNNTGSPNDTNTHTPNHKTQIMPGQWLEARIEVAELPVALAVTKTALQTMSAEGAAEAQTGVFIKQGNHYIFTPLSLGRSDEHYVEVLAGLAANTEYVSQNSYLVKADIEKSTAEHEH
jgi:cobalt-zinc-cadmium efflux system membrane fusion protein